MGQAPFRLIGVGLSALVPASGGGLVGDLLEPEAAKRQAAELAADRIRARFGRDAIILGRSLR
jgi:DNA polymerase-4